MIYRFLSCIFVFAIVAIGISAFANTIAVPETCMRPQVQHQMSLQMAAYSHMGGVGVAPAQQSFFIAGRTAKVVVMFHGFLSSPQEMVNLASELHQKTGDAIYAPLIFGFGDDNQVTNLSTLAEWQASIHSAMDLASSCYSEIEVIGYSMGGGLATDFLLHQPDIAKSGHYHKSQIDDVVLFSPYWLPHPLSLILEPIVAMQLTHRQSMPFSEVRQMVDPQLIRELFPDFNDADVIPLLALSTLLQMKKLFLMDNPGTAVLPMPVMVIYADDDPLIDTRFIPIFSREHFLYPQFKVYPSGSGVRHQTLQRGL